MMMMMMMMMIITTLVKKMVMVRVMILPMMRMQRRSVHMATATKFFYHSVTHRRSRWVTSW